ncbi:hypothetical protein L6164_021692 [Bauhinia variegata]|uniref:Uncharacterized protein n=1 Tax=Bauhinia variegata TaxID=167791 RepID=A0ACB9MZA3_BAUVA|nr:hypothetical protein L6164_021692 [Bauhinia variegata]
MDILHKMIFPVRRLWLALAARLKHRNNGTGLLKLEDDVQTCGYEDVQVMWEMLVDNNHKIKQGAFWRIFAWCESSSSVTMNHSTPKSDFCLMLKS